jgi:TP901 family phage tail tape measure protein
MPGEKIGDIFAELSVNDAKFRSGLNSASAAMRASFVNINTLAIAAGVAVTAAMAGMAASSVEAVGEFDAAMTQSLAIMDDVTQTMEADMVNAANKLSKELGVAAPEMARGFFFLASAGMDAEQSIAALPVVAKFAKAGMFDTARATELLAGSQAALGLAVDDSVQNMENMIRVSDVLVKANVLSQATTEEFATALATDSAAAMRAFGIEIEEGVAVLAAFAKQNVKGAKAGSMFGRALRLLIKGASENSAAYEKLGVAVFDSEGELRNIADIVEDLEGLLEGASTETRAWALNMLGFKARTQQAILPLLGMSDAIREFESELDNAGGTTETVVDKQLTAFNEQLKRTQEQINAVKRAMGEQLAPTVQELAGHIALLGDTIEKKIKEGKFNKLADAILNAGIAFATFGFGARVDLKPPKQPDLVGIDARNVRPPPLMSKFLTEGAGFSRQREKQTAEELRKQEELGKEFDQFNRDMLKTLEAETERANKELAFAIRQGLRARDDRRKKERSPVTVGFADLIDAMQRSAADTKRERMEEERERERKRRDEIRDKFLAAQIEEGEKRRVLLEDIVEQLPTVGE